ncbi:hypothetical protein [Bacillus wiedmannii]|uniref:hypothetical protein n=1 Tax=Bacillus wiedmannii TaxID=1890302 RepID=UPI0015CF22D5|nr:hypothetical protein [Bacillus wiedmannii]
MVRKTSYKEKKELQKQQFHRIIREKGNPWYHGTSLKDIKGKYILDVIWEGRNQAVYF